LATYELAFTGRHATLLASLAQTAHRTAAFVLVGPAWLQFQRSQRHCKEGGGARHLLSTSRVLPKTTHQQTTTEAIMTPFLSSQKRCAKHRYPAPLCRRGFEALEARLALSTSYLVHDLVSDQPGFAPITDPSLVNAWGIAIGPVTMWVSSNEKDLSTVYTGDVNGSPFAKNSLEVNIPGGAPTGQVFNTTTSDFVVTDGTNSAKALFIFASESGAVTGWAPTVPPPPPSHDAQPAFQATDGAIYKGIALANDNVRNANFLYLTDFHNNKIDVLDSSFDETTLGGTFTDPNLPSGFAPFNIAAINGKLYVTYAKQDADAEDDVAGRGNGLIDVFTTDGMFEKRLVTRGPLNSPWGMVRAPSNFGDFSNDLLVGNFGDGRINAFNPTTGAFLGTLSSSRNRPLETEGLWGLAFGNGTTAGDTNTLYFAAGPDDESHGLLGKITANAAGTSPVSATLHDGVLTVLGSRGNDSIALSPLQSKINVFAGSQKIGSFDTSSINTIEVFGVRGNDTISVSSRIHITTLLDGGADNDLIFGGGGSNILLGGTGYDLLVGGLRRDILIGGDGHDKLLGDGADDILIGGSTVHDANPVALLQILGEWNSTDSFADRKSKLRNGTGGLPALNASTVIDDHLADLLIGGSGQDWRFDGVHDILA
jgi:uncharacterized protein (TIGR03118 family)